MWGAVWHNWFSKDLLSPLLAAGLKSESNQPGVGKSSLQGSSSLHLRWFRCWCQRHTLHQNKLQSGPLLHSYGISETRSVPRDLTARSLHIDGMLWINKATISQGKWFFPKQDMKRLQASNWFMSPSLMQFLIYSPFHKWTLFWEKEAEEKLSCGNL